MNPRKMALAALVACALLAGCGAQHEGGPEAVHVGSLTGGAYLLRVDRVWDRATSNQSELPSDSIPESEYRTVDDGTEHRVVFDPGGTTVSVGETPMIGHQIMLTELSRTYDLREGTFAGGRFVVWVVDQSYQAELTLYGSGLPVVQSERGALLPAE